MILNYAGRVIFFCCYISLVPEINTFKFRTDQKSPVILVPGFFFSRIEAKLDRSSVVKDTCAKQTASFYDIYLNTRELVGNTDCWIDNMRLIYDNVTKKTRSPEGVTLRVAGWGDPASVENVDAEGSPYGAYFTELANVLVNDMGYVRNVSLRAAPYDFRKGPAENEEFFIKLKELVEETYEINDKLPVTLIAHSMGGLMSLIFLQRQSQNWKDQYINSLITLSVSWGGAVKSLEKFAVGDNFGFPGKIDTTKIRTLMASFPSLAFLSPSKPFWNDEVLIESSSKNYTLADLKDYFGRIEVPNGYEFYENNEEYQLNITPPGVIVHCLYGTNVPTVEKLQYQSEIKPNDEPTLISGDGDGTVNLRSLEGCKYWVGVQKEEIHCLTLPGVQHTDILKNKEALEYIKNNLAVVIDSTVTIDCAYVESDSDNVDGQIDMYDVEGTEYSDNLGDSSVKVGC